MPVKRSIKSRVRVSDLPHLIRRDSKVADTVSAQVQVYVFALMISGFPKSLTNIAVYFGTKLHSLSRMLSHVGIGRELDVYLNRQTRSIIAHYLNHHDHVSVDIIIDATIIERSSRKGENVGLYHSNGKKVWGHRLTNIGMLLDGTLYIPLGTISHYTRKYTRYISGLNYLSEGTMVRNWLREHIGGVCDVLGSAGINKEDVTFLLDAGYDNKRIQRAILSYGCHFLMMIKSSRKVSGLRVKEFFKKNRRIAWQSIYITKDSRSKKKRLKYRIRTAEQVELNGVGLVNVVCSEKVARGRGQESTRRYLVSSRQNSTGKEIVRHYRRRWAIESWHKTMKQNYGFGDCSVSTFASMENHFKMCNIAYLSHLQNIKSWPKKGTTIEDFLQLSVRKNARHLLTKIDGRSKFAQEIKQCQENVFSFAA